MRKRAKRRSRKNNIFKSKIFWTFFVFLGIFGTLGYFLLFSDYFQLKGTDISGVQTISEEDLMAEFSDKTSLSLNMLGFNLDSSSIFIPSQGEIAQILENFPEIADIEVKKDFLSQKITLEITEKTPVCIWCYNGECSLLDKNATYIRDYDDETGFIKINEYDKYEDSLEDWCKKTKKEFLIDLLLVYKNNNQIKNFSIYADKFFGIYKGIDLIFDPKEDMDWQIEKMNIILQKLGTNIEDVEYIDLRFEEQAIVK